MSLMGGPGWMRLERSRSKTAEVACRKSIRPHWWDMIIMIAG